MFFSCEIQKPIPQPQSLTSWMSSNFRNSKNFNNPSIFIDSATISRYIAHMKADIVKILSGKLIGKTGQLVGKDGVVVTQTVTPDGKKTIKATPVNPNGMIRKN
jgi:hypothetical protein